MPYNFQRDNFMLSHKRKCPVCGKTFWSSAEWVYKKRDVNYERIYCSWKCLRAEEKSKMTLGDRINKALDDGLNDAEIRKLLGVSQKQIDYRKIRRVPQDE